MALKLVGKRFAHILADDKKSKAPTVFVIKELSAAERTKMAAAVPFTSLPVGADMETVMQMQEKLQSSYRKVCDIGLIEAAPILDCDGQAVDLPIEQVLDGIADPAHINELALAIIKANRLSEKERKKSARPRKRVRQD